MTLINYDQSTGTVTCSHEHVINRHETTQDNKIFFYSSKLMLQRRQHHDTTVLYGVHTVTIFFLSHILFC